MNASAVSPRRKVGGFVADVFGSVRKSVDLETRVRKVRIGDLTLAELRDYVRSVQAYELGFWFRSDTDTLQAIIDALFNVESGEQVVPKTSSIETHIRLTTLEGDDSGTKVIEFYDYDTEVESRTDDAYWINSDLHTVQAITSALRDVMSSGA